MSMAKKDIQKLRDLRRHLQMETCRFGTGSPGAVTDITDFIREQTHVRREHFIHALDELLEKYDPHQKCHKQHFA